MSTVTYRNVDVDGIRVFYREAGPKEAPTILLLHAFPNAGHIFRDHPATGRPVSPRRSRPTRFWAVRDAARGTFTYAFENIASVIDRFVEVIGPHRFAIYVFDDGAPVGFRLAVRHPDRITVIISQNGNAYEEGLSDGWNPIRAYCQEPLPANRKALRSVLAPETTRWHYTHGVPDATAISPDGYSLDNFYLARQGADGIQLHL